MAGEIFYKIYQNQWKFYFVLRLVYISLRVSSCTISMGEAAKSDMSAGIQISKLEEVSYEMFVLKFVYV